jgi:hypothetical protein
VLFDTESAVMVLIGRLRGFDRDAEALYLETAEQYVRTQGSPVWDKLAEGATARAASSLFGTIECVHWTYALSRSPTSQNADLSGF